MKRKRRRLAVTLIEMIIVMILIASITGVLAVSYRGMLEKGNAFKTEQRMRRLEAIITTHIMENTDKSGDQVDWLTVVRNSPLAGERAEDLMCDGWGKKFNIVIPPLDQSDWKVTITSEALNRYKGSGSKTGRSTQNP